MTNIGIPKECRPDEFRVGVSPVGVRMLKGAGHACFVESGAGDGSGFPDEQYRQAGATIVHSAEEAWRRADLVLKVSRPTLQELDWLQPGKALMGYLYLAAAHPGKVDVLLVDKTGTLTAGKPALAKVVPEPGAGLDEATLLRLVASLERGSEHPLASAIVAGAKARGLALSEAQDFKATQTITFASPGNQILGTPPFALNATASSGLPVTITSTTASVCTVSVGVRSRRQTRG